MTLQTAKAQSKVENITSTQTKPQERVTKKAGQEELGLPLEATKEYAAATS